jgi:molecular chaperone GrpE
MDDKKASEETASAGKQAWEKEREEMKDRFLRLAAEFDNYKKRTAKELEGAKGIGKAECVSHLLPVLDEFEIAIESMALKSESEKGIALIFSNLLDTLRKDGLREINSQGRFDPYKHEIVLTRESQESDGTIIETIRKGYMLNEIMLRPASVVVSKETKQEQGKTT